jgi:hypothetical protein
MRMHVYSHCNGADARLEIRDDAAPWKTDDEYGDDTATTGWSQVLRAATR